MNFSLDWLYDPSVFQVGREKAHSDHDFSTPEGSLRQSLSGVWKFAYAERPEERIADIVKPDYLISALDDIRVPGHIQLQGWGRCQYVNNYYPWDGCEQVKAPQVPGKSNPVGSYVRTFTLDESMKNKTCFVSFQGVENAFYVWINGHFAGYSEDSFTPSEFNITPYLCEGENRIAVEVYKYSTASWLEDQDFWRFSGIFRDVYLYAIPEVHVRDMRVTADYDHLTGAGTLGVGLELVGEGLESGAVSAEIALTDAEGNAVFARTSPAGESMLESAQIDKALPWSAECPNLYTLTVKLTAADGRVIETASTRVGFRTFAMVDGIMCLNGKRIIFKGVNRHEFSAERGRAITEGDMLYDIRLLKQNNINAVRTSHYPNNSLWYRLCDEYGIYLIDESNLETHGAWLDVPNSLPEWRGAVVDRAVSMYQRDKNHPSVLIWSCGNESYADDNIAAMSEFFHSVDSRRLVHYEGVFHNRKYDYISDMESRMYAKPCEIAEYLEQNTGKPYLSCEYMHAMGNSLGGMKLYTDLEDRYEGYQGGFIWDYIDQALWLTDDETDRTLAYGGDFGDRNTDYNFCTNGLIYADRTPSPKLREAKALYSNIRITVENGVAAIENRNLFADTSAYDFVMILQKEGGTVLDCRIAQVSAAPGEKVSFELGLARPTDSGEYVYTVSCVLAESTQWADAGHEIAFGQEIIKIDAPAEKCEKGDTVVVYGDFSVGVRGRDFSMLFDKKECGISSLVYGGREYITRAPKVSFWRAPTDNDIGAGYPNEMAQWLIAGRNAKYHADRFATEEKDDRLEVSFEFTAATVPSFDYKVVYSAYYDGRLGVRAEYPGAAGLPDMPVFAMDFKLPKAYDRFIYYGLGPNENYIDRANGSKLDIYGMTAAENLSGYLNPQECGNRTGVRYVRVVDENGTGIRFDHTEKPFEMSVLPYSAHELDNASHINELPQVQYTWVRIAAKQMGVGGDDSWGAPVHDEFKIPAREPMTLEFVISPCSTGRK